MVEIGNAIAKLEALLSDTLRAIRQARALLPVGAEAALQHLGNAERAAQEAQRAVASLTLASNPTADEALAREFDALAQLLRAHSAPARAVADTLSEALPPVRGAHGHTRVLVAAGSAVTRQGLRRILEGATGLMVVAEADDVLDTLAKVQELQPAVLIATLPLAEGGVEVITQVRARNPEVAILVLVPASEEAAALAALEAGARGALLDDASPDELLRAVKAVARGEAPLAPALSSRLLARLRRGDMSLSPDRLTARELEVLKLVADGLRNKDIAKRLQISERTATFHVGNVLAKLDAGSRTQAAQKARKLGLIRD